MFDVLHIADVYLLPGLKKLCGNTIGSYLDVDNVTTVLRTARLMGLGRLEEECAMFMSKNLETVRKHYYFQE